MLRRSTLRILSPLSLTALALATVHCGSSGDTAPPSIDDSAVDETSVDSTTPETSADSASDTTVPETSVDSSVDANVDSSVDATDARDASDTATDTPTDTTPPPPGTWRQTGGPLGGLIDGFAFNSKGDVYCVADEVYAFKRPKGATWQAASTNLFLEDNGGHYPPRMAIGPTDDVYLWFQNDSLLRSTDDGATWARRWKGTIFSFAISASGNQFIGSSGTNSLRRSKDGGVTFVEYAGLGGSLINVVASGTTVLASGGTGPMLRSSDDGDTFTAPVTGLPTTNTYGHLAIQGNVAYAVAQNLTTYKYEAVYKSIDSGATWTKTGITPPPYPSFLVIDPSVAAGGRVYIPGTDGGLGGVLVVSSDGGTTSASTTPFGMDSSSVPRGVSGFGVSPTGEVFAGLTSGYEKGVFRSTDHGATFANYSETLVATSASGIAVRTDPGATSTNGDLFAYSKGDGTVQRSTDGGKTWKRLTGGYVPTNGDFAISPKGTLFQAIQRSTDDGDTFTVSSPVLATGAAVNFHGFTASGDVLLALPGALYRSKDEGATWGIGDTTMANATNFVRGKGVLIATIGMTLKKSIDDGVSWSTWTPDFTPVVAGSVVPTPELALADGTLFFAVDAYPAGKKVSYLARSTDGGVTWSAIGSTFAPKWEVAAMTADGAGTVYASVKVTPTDPTQSVTYLVYQSTDKGSTWTDVSIPKVNVAIPGLATDKTGTLFAATKGLGVWAR